MKDFTAGPPAGEIMFEDQEEPAMPSSYGGIYRGRVVSSADPMGSRRVQINVPAILGATASWALLCAPFGSSGTPSVGAPVWVMFENGDIDFPVVMGAIPGG